MRVNGRLLRPSTLAERRVLKSLGLDALRCPRTANPYAVARFVQRIVRGTTVALTQLAALAIRARPVVPQPSPAPDAGFQPADAAE